MEKSAKSKWQVRFAAIAIFILGFAAGALALNAYRLWFASAWRPQGPEQRSERVFKSLGLTDEQKSQTQQILSDTRDQLRALRVESAPKIREIRKNADDRLQKVLTQEQWTQFQKMREERRDLRRGRDNDQRGPDNEPSGP